MNPSHKIRIIAGQWRSRQLSVAPIDHVRPTGNRIRETLFNWLQHDIPGAHCLDLFAGSGALGFEALSRGAASVVMIEEHPIAVEYLLRNAQQLDARHLQIKNQNALIYLSTPPAVRFDIVFLDPPFSENLLETCLSKLNENQFLNAPAKIYLEYDKPLESIQLPPSFELIRHQKAGQVYYGLIVPL